MLGLYRAGVETVDAPGISAHTIISLPVQTAACPYRAVGALVMLVGVHVSSVHVGVPSVVIPGLSGPEKASNVPAETIRK
jgi:hypothetical protein